MAKIVRLDFSPGGEILGTSEFGRGFSEKQVRFAFRALYNTLSEDYKLEVWDSFTFYVPSCDIIYSLQF